MLSQLSYSPIVVGLGRFELPTSPLSGVRSNQLSYRPQSGTCAERIGPTWLVSSRPIKGFEDQVEHAQAATPLVTIDIEITTGREGLIQAPLDSGGPELEGDSQPTRYRSSPQSRIRKLNYAFLS